MSPLRGILAVVGTLLDTLRTTMLNPLRTILNPAHAPEEASEVFWRLTFRVLVLGALLSFILNTAVGGAAARHPPETFPLSQVKGCSIAYSVVCGICFVIGFALWVRIDYFRYNAVPPPPSRDHIPPTSWMPGFEAEEMEARISASTSYSVDPKISARDRSVDLPSAGVSELDGESTSRAASPHGPIQGLQQSGDTTSQVSYHDTTTKADLVGDSFPHNAISSRDRPSSSPEASPKISPPRVPTYQQYPKSQDPPSTGRAKHRKFSWQSSSEPVSGGEDKEIDITEQSSSSSSPVSAMTATTGGRRSQDSRHPREAYSDARYYAEVAEGPPNLPASFKATVEDVYHADFEGRHAKRIEEPIVGHNVTRAPPPNFSRPQQDWI